MAVLKSAGLDLTVQTLSGWTDPDWLLLVHKLPVRG